MLFLSRNSSIAIYIAPSASSAALYYVLRGFHLLSYGIPQTFD
nr:MAG TPA: hypothetical protein [Caudoviricetes sp.]